MHQTVAYLQAMGEPNILVDKPRRKKIPTELECNVDKYKDIFKGTDKLKNYQCDLFVDSTVKPIQQKLNRQPYHYEKRLDQNFKNLKKKIL